MAFSDDINAFAAKVKRRQQALLVGTVELLDTSIKDGHALTGAPGQLVDTSFLINSWQITFPSTNTAQTATNVSYAKVVEDGVRTSFNPKGVDRPPRKKVSEGGARYLGPSKVGGHHSVKLTRAAWPKIVQHVTRGLA